MMKRPGFILSCSLIVVVIAGCASSKPSRFYTLSSTSTPAGVLQTNCSVSVGPVSIPAMVDRQQIVVQAGPNEILINEFERWASPLKVDIGRVVAENLSSLLGTTHVTLFPQSSAAEASYRVRIDVLHLDSNLGKSAYLDAFWVVSSGEGGSTHRGRTKHTETVHGKDYADLIAAHSRSLGRLSADIAQKIQEIEAGVLTGKRGQSR